MLFRRREPLGLIRKMREMLWPSMGWNRTYHYFRHRVLRRSATAHQITAGLAIGVGTSFTPLLGTHLFQAVFFAWIFKVNALAALLGTAFGNPWTFPFMFWLDYKLGEALFTAIGGGKMIALPEMVSLHFLLANPLRLMLPMMLGGYLCGILAWPVAYAAFYFPVRGMHRAYRYQKIRRLRQRQLARRAALKGA